MSEAGASVAGATVVPVARARLARPWVSSALGWTSATLALAPLLIGVTSAAVMGWSKPGWWETFLGLSWGGALVAGAAALGARVKASTWERAQLRVAGDAIALGDGGTLAWTAAKEDVARAVAVPGKGATLFMRDGRQLAVETDDASAERLLGALGLGADARRLETAMRPSAMRAPLMIGVVVGLHVLAMQLAEKLRFMTSAQGVILLLAALISITTVWLGTRAPQIEVGADGVTLRRAVGARFFRFEAIAEVAYVDGALTLTLHDGTQERLVVTKKNREQLMAAHRRIELGLAAQQGEALAPARLALLSRGGRSFEAWRQELARVMQGDAGFRRSPLSEDDVSAILASPSATPEHRVGAALALRVAEGERAAAKIRVAAESCAESETRQALLQIAEDEAALAEETLARLEA